MILYYYIIILLSPCVLPFSFLFNKFLTDAIPQGGNRKHSGYGVQLFSCKLPFLVVMVKLTVERIALGKTVFKSIAKTAYFLFQDSF